jgi:hypothetical protein
MSDDQLTRRRGMRGWTPTEPDKSSPKLPTFSDLLLAQSKPTRVVSELPSCSKESIVAAIQSKAGRAYGVWRIGITNDPTERRRCWTDDEKQNCTLWQQWKAESLADAEAIEAYFIRMGMKGGTGGHASAYKPVYVYVF